MMNKCDGWYSDDLILEIANGSFECEDDPGNRGLKSI